MFKALGRSMDTASALDGRRDDIPSTKGDAIVISIVDYGMGNLRSVEKSFTSQGIDVRVTADPGDIESSSGIVLPGVGAFGDCVRNLRERSMIGPIKDFIGSGRPFLGICLGFQVLFESSEEAPGERGLKVFRGKVVRFRPRRRK